MQLYGKGGVLHKKNPLQKVYAGQSGSQNWKKTSENLGKNIKEQRWRVLKLNFDFLSVVVLSNDTPA